jgi:PAS domain-containing protein
MKRFDLSLSSSRRSFLCELLESRDALQKEAEMRIQQASIETALRASEEHFRLIVDGIPGLVVTMTANGEIELLSRQVLEYFGMGYQSCNPR